MRYPVLETENLFLRKPLPQDFPAQTPGARDWHGVASVLDHWDARGFGPFALICKNTDLCLGLAGPWSPLDWPEAELVWHLWDRRTTDALVTEAAREAQGFARSTLGWDIYVSYVAFANRAGQTLAETLGAVRDRFAETPVGRDCLVYRHGVADRGHGTGAAAA